MQELEKLFDRIIQRVNINLRELEYDVNPFVQNLIPLNQLVKLTTPLRYPGQRLIAMKGQYPSVELEALNRECAAQIDSVSVQALKVPGLNAERHAVTIKFV